MVEHCRYPKLLRSACRAVWHSLAIQPYITIITISSSFEVVNMLCAVVPGTVCRSTHRRCSISMTGVSAACAIAAGCTHCVYLPYTDTISKVMFPCFSCLACFPASRLDTTNLSLCSSACPCLHLLDGGAVTSKGEHYVNTRSQVGGALTVPSPGTAVMVSRWHDHDEACSKHSKLFAGCKMGRTMMLLQMQGLECMHTTIVCTCRQACQALIWC